MFGHVLFQIPFKAELKDGRTVEPIEGHLDNQRASVNDDRPEKLLVLESQVPRAKTAHRVALDRPPLALSNRAISLVDVRNQVLDDDTLHRPLAVGPVAVKTAHHAV